MYPVPPKPETFGRTEEILGTWLAKNRSRRKDVIVATKVTGGSNNIRHVRDGARLDAGSIRIAVEGSLRRLQTDYIDVYQSHSPDRPANFFGTMDFVHRPDANPGTPLEETLETMAALVKEGKIRHFGISNETPWGMMKHLELAASGKGPRIVSIQNAYNLLNRCFDIGHSEIALREEVGLLAYSPLAMGVLAGKYLNGARPAGSRLMLYDRFKRYSTPRAEPAAAEYVRIAREAGLDPAQMALAFVTGRPFLAATIIGATTPAQLAADIASIDVKLPPDVLAAIERIHASSPNPCS
jgi:aryl-alcohol dehydrogenase-like predicted oxidoreductase